MPTRCSSTEGWTSARPSLPPAEQRGVPHHLLDIWDVTETASVAEYQSWPGRDRRHPRPRAAPVLVGGSGLYVRAALDDLDFPGTDPAIRARLEAELAERGPARAVRPAAGRPTRPPPRRSCRATAAGSCARWRSSRSPARPFTRDLPSFEALYPSVQIGAGRARPELDERIDGPGRPDVGGGPGRRGPGPGRRRACATAVPRAARSATPRCCASSTASGPRSRRSRETVRRDQAVRPPPGVLVPPRSPDPLARR